MFTTVFLAMLIVIPSWSQLCGVEWGERFNTEFFFYHRKKMYWMLADVSKGLRFDERLAIETPVSLGKFRDARGKSFLMH